MPTAEDAIELVRLLAAPVFPLAGKVPRTPHGFKDATLDPNEIRALWDRHPDAGIGVATGRRLLVLDVDPRNGGSESLAGLERRNGSLPPTVETSTGGGGRHLYFHTFNGFRPSCATIAAGIDVKAEGGYVVAPPSLHPSGRRYEWVRSPTDARIAECPAWLAELLQKRVEAKKVDRSAVDYGGAKDAARAWLEEQSDKARDKGQHAQDYIERTADAATAAVMAEEDPGRWTSESLTPLSIPAPEYLALLDAEPLEAPMLVEELWGEQAVGFFGGEPKTLKSWAALEVALCVATGAKVFGRFAIPQPGAVLVVQEESRAADYGRRLAMLARAHGIEPSDLGALHLASQPGLLLDDEAGIARLRAEVERVAPILVVHDPLVRGIGWADADSVKEMGPVLRALRRLQADYGCAVLVVHHLRKQRQGAKDRPGQRLRGTGDLHALASSALYFAARPGARAVEVEVEHREAAPPEPFTLSLDVDHAEGVARLTATDGGLDELLLAGTLEEVVEVLRTADGLTAKEVERAVSRRGKTVREALRQLEEAGRATATTETRPDAAGRARRVNVWRST